MGLRISHPPNGLWFWNCRYLTDSLIKPFHQGGHWSHTRSLIHIMQSTAIIQFSRALHTWIEIIPNHSIYHQAQSTYQAWVFLDHSIRKSLWNTLSGVKKPNSVSCPLSLEKKGKTFFYSAATFMPLGKSEDKTFCSWQKIVRSLKQVHKYKSFHSGIYVSVSEL